MDGWRVVTLAAGDYDAVRALWEAAGLPIRPTGRDSREAFAEQIEGGTQTVIGLEQGGRLIGVVLATHDGRKGWINRLAVDPAVRRKGAGRRLIEEAECLLKAQGMSVIAALIEGSNGASLALFEQAGYETHPDIHYVSKRDRGDV
ncbi:MAG TPA: GNAT family N-acetyltransferase [Aggregatilinea sp.]|uniref:GNAT family N-acetyltransferase n=1 Tax=Aggregatilinea sp. TaxID=2806333 RepID=UPI002BAB871B|nr:GNAT family N-acetyltransferase [Aggregatilinea sp.]HML20002.1 GNAT family N-acetyltransferase [Aggregatilinea sp.]